MDYKNNLLSEIRESNLTYMMLAQALIRQDRASALLQLGLNESVAQIVEALSPAQIIKLAQSNLLMCRMRFDDSMIWSLLSEQQTQDNGMERSASRLHASILMAGQVEDAF